MRVPDQGPGMLPLGGPRWDTDGAGDADERGAIRLDEVAVGYGREPVLAEVSLAIEPGDFVCVEGPSGAGKTTLLRLLYGVLRPQRGLAIVDGIDLGRLRRRHVSRFRRRLGCVFQSYDLLPHLTALQNVMLPLQLAQPNIAEPRRRAAETLDRLGLWRVRDSRPPELSGGQQQRVAIARAIAHEPRILLADEPTGNLDAATTAEVMRAFEDYHDRGGTVILATHDEGLRDRHARRLLRIRTRAA